MNYTEKLIAKYGRDVNTFDSNNNSVQKLKCFIQPLRYKNKMYIQGTPTDIGFNYSGYYLLIAPASFDVDKLGENGYLADNEKKYHIDRSEKVYFGSQVFYIWAILREHNDGSYPIYNHFR